MQIITHNTFIILHCHIMAKDIISEKFHRQEKLKSDRKRRCEKPGCTATTTSQCSNNDNDNDD